MKTSVIAYVYSIVVASAAALVLSYLYDPSFAFSLFAVPGLLAFVAFFGAISSYRIQGSTFGEISFIPYLTAIVLYPSWSTLGAIGVGALLAEVAKPKTGIKRAFNVGQTVLAGAAALFSYALLGGVALQTDKAFQPIPHVAAVLSFLLVNTFAVATAIGLAEGKSIIKTWAKGNVAGLAYDAVAVLAVYAFARAYVDWGLWGILGFCGILVVLRFTYQSKHQLQTTNKELLELFVHTVEFRDPYTSGHSQRVRRFSRIIAQEIGLSPKEVEQVSKAALLHDVGKIHEIFAPILMKPGRLTPEERAIMELHPIKSAELVAKISELQDIVPAVRHHHENWDGTGYPDRLQGKEIPLASRIIMFADTIDAMTTDRPYRKALGEADVRAELVKFSGTQFDPHICAALLGSEKFSRIFDKNDDGDVYSLTQIIDAIRKRRHKTPAVA
ncbi:MAG: HD-GYP domain-containing protein [Gemmatimonas sp.]|jgi:putative nucleotidyltransferase with HDIG domain|uniref:HD-GYP domain-containing protein n=1 Tax=Gemmatimonas sp. TaxID=1962908 RepID=UPI0022C72410|nr:HD-GYP domain-containing protein [Gemmatimonas sp.]MCZ8266775.1 HD-GYP domain-containing protein [Gemmatimonas sp.]